jgi:hypothetical protein
LGAGSAATDTRIEPLRDALDDAALAGCIATFENHHHLELLVDHPVLQLHQLALQAEQLLEVGRSLDCVLLVAACHVADQRIEPPVVEFQLQFFLEAVDQLFANARVGCVGILAYFHAILAMLWGHAQHVANCKRRNVPCDACAIVTAVVIERGL